MENNLEEEILGGVKFDENGLPIIENLNVVGGEPGVFHNKSSLIIKENLIIKEKLVISDDDIIVNSMIDRAKKINTKLQLSLSIDLISLSLFDLIKSDFENVDENKICEMIFEKCIEQKELKEKMIESIKDYYNYPRSI